MIGFITDANNDIMLDSIGNLKTADGADAYRQHIMNRLRLQQYEYPYDLTRGINWLGYVFGDGANIPMWQTQVLDMVGNIDFVKSVVDWRYNVDGNNLLFRLVVDTDYGQIDFKG